MTKTGVIFLKLTKNHAKLVPKKSWEKLVKNDMVN